MAADPQSLRVDDAIELLRELAAAYDDGAAAADADAVHAAVKRKSKAWAEVRKHLAGVQGMDVTAGRREQMLAVFRAIHAWQAGLTDERVPYEQKIARRETVRAAVYALAGLPQEPIDGVTAPVRTWQHDETGRITQTAECPGPRWVEVPAGVDVPGEGKR